MKNILITGANGFIGSFLVEEAIRKGWQTWAGIRKSSNKEYLQDERIQFIYLDYTCKEKLKEQIKQQVAQYGKWDYVIHNLGVTKCIRDDDFEKINYSFTKCLIESLQETDNIPEKFVLMSSLGAHHPESDTAYGRSKLKAEQFLKEQKNTFHIILCPTGVYGPREKDYLLVLKTIQAGLNFTIGFKPQKLSFIYVKDLVKVTFLALEYPVYNKTYHVADGNVYSDQEYADIAKNALGKKHIIKIKIPLNVLKIVSIVAEKFSHLTRKPSTLNRDKYKIMKQRDWSCDISSLQTDLGFKADYDLKRGLKECVDWYRANGWL
jgi:nucleoside-diphosphate-sugar epimerase